MPLPGGGRIVIYDPMRPGPARDFLARGGAGLLGLELGSADLAGTCAYLDRATVGYVHAEDGRGSLVWINPTATPGILRAVRAGGR